MIFCFSATGNSLYAAQRLAEATGDTLIDIGEALRGGKYEYDAAGDERIGFVAPTFAGTLPGAVGIFIERLRLTGAGGRYVYGVFTCGGSDGFEPAALYAMLKAKGIGFDGSYTVVMPDNYIVWSDVPPEPALGAILDGADKALDVIIEAVKAKKPGKIDERPPQMLYMPLTEVSASKGTGALFADGSCAGCGLCAENCPMGCVTVVDGRARWEGLCTMCFACLHRCPARAVQHGNDTQNKGRYVNPRVRF
ncbi:MAG: EFR1 family ferrodoxin [Oscillospiraceae bacterium]|jgi:ferredoxin/flavodoxin|nr:EFR1 family ferrodoxin [Oscillospiraceae bacterium]